jgi:epoxide hydrolase 4
VQHFFQTANGIRLHCVHEGEGAPVLMLHGFPDFWYSWRHQFPALSSSGYRSIAIDLRGYNLSERPRGVAAYKLETLAGDVASLIDALGDERPVVIGHDWGGIIGWHLAMHHAHRVRALVVLNAPHPITFRRELRRLSAQWLRSSYAAFFQLPFVPESTFRAANGFLLKQAFRHGPAQTAEDLEKYLSAFSTRESLSAPLHYYRAALRYHTAKPDVVHLPTMVLWGERDPFLGLGLAEGLEPWVPELEVVRFRDAGHWLHISHAQQVNERLLAFLQHIAARPLP